MKIYNNANLSRKHLNGVIAIGNFDGLHIGHQKVIREARQKAKKFKLPLGVMTFEPVPVMFFSKKKKDHRINSLQQKKSQLKKLKLDFLIIIKFNKKFSSLSPEQFISKIINKKTKCRYLYVSRNFKFGFKRRGNIKTLKNSRKNSITKI
ncbi:MAG: adenylyltransferase/cytidyltransferase family protein [Candidatus Pelagibacter sp.]